MSSDDLDPRLDAPTAFDAAESGDAAHASDDDILGAADLRPRVGAKGDARLATEGPALHTATARALRSERFFWWRLTALLAMASALGAVGVWKVRERSQGIRVAQKLAVVDAQLREAVETNLTLEAEILRELDPVQLLKQGVEEFDMAAGDPDEAVVVP